MAHKVIATGPGEARRTVKLTADELAAREAEELAAAQEIASKAYQEERKKAYGSIADQLDYIVHYGVEAFRQRNLDIKTKYPKPE